MADTAKHHAKMLVRTAFGLPTWKQPKLDVNRRTTLIIDECAMVDNEKLSRALAHAEKAGCRVVLVGDPGQLRPSGRGGFFEELWEQARDDQKTALTDIVRQREEWAREAIHRSAGARPRRLSTAYKEHGRLHVLPTREEAERQLVERLEAGGNSEPAGEPDPGRDQCRRGAAKPRAQACPLGGGATGLSFGAGRRGAHPRRRPDSFHRHEQEAWAREVGVCDGHAHRAAQPRGSRCKLTGRRSRSGFRFGNSIRFASATRRRCTAPGHDT